MDTETRQQGTAATARTPVGLLAAVRRHPFVALTPIVVLVAVAGALGFARTPEYTATAQLSVGSGPVDSPAGIPGVITATQSLAAVYARAVRSQDVRDGAVRRLGGRPVGGGALSATPIPESPLIKVTATSSSSDGAVRLANAGAASLAAYVNRTQRSDSRSRTAFRRYNDAAVEYRARVRDRGRARSLFGSDPSGENRVRVDRADGAVDAARLRRDSLQTVYESALQGTASNPEVDLFTQARGASDDRRSVLQILVFVGLLGGVVVGLALALGWTRRETRPTLSA